MEHKTGCLLCGAELVYQQHGNKIPCLYCSQLFDTNVTCKNGHFVCDKCHSSSASELITTHCLSTQETNPIIIAETLMQSPAVKMHGPEHHYLVPAVLITSYCNIKGIQKEKYLLEAQRRAKNVLGGFCGYYGSCGAAVGTGIFMSIVTGANPLSKMQWRLCNQMTGKSLIIISEYGGPRCCKRNSYLAIKQAVQTSIDAISINMPLPEIIVCKFNEHNKECIKENCPFYSNPSIIKVSVV